MDDNEEEASELSISEMVLVEPLKLELRFEVIVLAVAAATRLTGACLVDDVDGVLDLEEDLDLSAVFSDDAAAAAGDGAELPVMFRRKPLSPLA